MAFTITRHNGQPANEIPAGHTKESAAELAAPGVQESKVLTHILTPAATYDNASLDTAMDAVYDALVTHVTTNVLEGAAATEGLGLDAADTISVRIVVLNILRQPSGYTPGDLKNQLKVSTDEIKVWYKIQWKVVSVAP